MIDHALSRFSRLILRYPWQVLLLFLILCALSIGYTSRHLGIQNNTAQLLDQDLPFQKVRLELERAFPQDASTLIVVVESETPEQTALAADVINRRLAAESSLFESTYIAGDDAFFRRQGFLYLDTEQLEALSGKLIEAQPFIGYLSQHFHFAGLVDIVVHALENRETDSAATLDTLLAAIDQTVVAANQGRSHLLSWQQLLTGTGQTQNRTRRLVIAKPYLDFDQLMPAEQPMRYLRELVAEMSALHPGVKMAITGEVALEHEEMETVNHDMLISGIISFVLVCGALWLGLRSARLLLATLIVLIIGLLLTAGFAAVAIGHLNLISVAFAVLYIGLGVDFATHLCLHYQECRSQNMTADDAIIDSMTAVGPSLLQCALTTAIGFFAFIPTDFKGVAELGIISGAGMFIGLAVSLSLLPALLKILSSRARPVRHSAGLPPRFYSFPFRRALAIRIAAVSLAFIATLSLGGVSFDSASINLRDPHSPSVIAFKRLLENQAESPFAISALADNLDQANRLAERFAALPSVHQAITFSDLLPMDQARKLEIIDNLNLMMPTQLSHFADVHQASDVRAALLTLQRALQKSATNAAAPLSESRINALHTHIAEFIQRADSAPRPDAVYKNLEDRLLTLLPHTLSLLRDSFAASPVTLDGIPDSLRRHWVSGEGKYRVLVTPAEDLNHREHLQQFVNQVMDTHASVFGLPIGDVTSGQAVVDAFIQAFSSALILIVLLLLLMTRSVKSTLLVVAPLLLAALLTGACNVWLNNPFNFANIIVLPLLLGMGVDSGIHIVQRLRHRPNDIDNLLHSSSARGVFFSALTTLCSFTSLAFNNHQGTASMGLLLSIGIVLTIICSQCCRQCEQG
ncbi:MAG: MMPL family transporter [Methylomonas sp.]|jgi:hypothetical protein|uniref:MMPL family transporter n=1 Tax=Methylomonas sp. TaxID=418 RepID=UPI0025D5E49C|nr:MMPL family transporter [Methylomonas sp.]MCK9606299.1 MMPL family transporter [Methylomonas sp.]